MDAEAKEKLNLAAHAVHTATMLITMERATIEAFLKECRDMDNFGSIVDPTLFRDPERRAVSALLQPTFQAALDFLTKYEAQMEKAKAALEKVKA